MNSCCRCTSSMLPTNSLTARCCSLAGFCQTKLHCITLLLRPVLDFAGNEAEGETAIALAVLKHLDGMIVGVTFTKTRNIRGASHNSAISQSVHKRPLEEKASVRNRYVTHNLTDEQRVDGSKRALASLAVACFFCCRLLKLLGRKLRSV
jgi:hypothetical protein